MIFFGALIGAIGFRLRGSALFEQWTGRGATTARIVCWAIPMALLADVPLEWLPLLALAFFLGAIPGWYGSLDLGRDDGQVLKDWAIMTVRGVVWTAPPAAVMTFIDVPISFELLFVGLLCPVAYTIGWNTPSNINHIRQGPELGEVIFGAFIGASLTL